MNKILLFIPIYNCEQQIIRVFDKITPEFLSYISEIIVIDNRSQDNSCKQAVECLKRLPIRSSLLKNHANYNLGGSIKVALNYALAQRYDYLLVLHGDDQADPHDIIPLLHDNATLDADLYIGARFHSQSRLQGYSLLRIAGNKGFNILLSLITGRRIDDLIAGLNLYRMQSFKERWYLKCPDDLTFDAHMLLYALYNKFKIEYFPISWREEDQLSNAKVFRQGWILLKLFLSYAVRKETALMRGRIFPTAYYSQLIYSHAGQV